jgi:hypothetical protein
LELFFEGRQVECVGALRCAFAFTCGAGGIFRQRVYVNELMAVSVDVYPLLVVNNLDGADSEVSDDGVGVAYQNGLVSERGVEVVRSRDG